MVLTFRGDVHIEKFDSLGRRVEVRDIHNLPLSVGKEILNDKLRGSTTLSGEPFKITWIGSSSTAPAASDKNCKAPVWASYSLPQLPSSDYSVGLFVSPSTMSHWQAISLSSTGDYVYWPGTTGAGADTYLITTQKLPTGLPYGEFIKFDAVLRMIVHNTDSSKVAGFEVKSSFSVFGGGIYTNEVLNPITASSGSDVWLTQSFTNSYVFGTAVNPASDWGMHVSILPNQGIGNTECDCRIYHAQATASERQYKYATNSFSLTGTPGRYVASSAHTGVAANVTEMSLGTDESSQSGLNRATFSTVSLQPADTLSIQATISFAEV
jgi:hypothetical protein